MTGQYNQVGPTNELSLRVSVATLSRVIFPRPGDGVTMLALEHKATVIPGASELQVAVKAQPFGGAIRISNLGEFIKQIGDFNFDSQLSQFEQDFRGYIQPSNWEAVREFCLRNLGDEDSRDLDSDPSRELVEEFNDTLGIQLQPHQYTLAPVTIVVENEPAPTTNLRASGNPTARIYRIDEVQIHDPNLARKMMANSKAHPGEVLQRLALADAQKGGRGRANAMLVAPVEEIRSAYLGIPPERRGAQLPFKDSFLAGNVAAVLEGIFVPKYRYAG
ncbi:MAG: hypothetical protein P8074_06285 [Anaerolineales bacterium]